MNTSTISNARDILDETMIKGLYEIDKQIKELQETQKAYKEAIKQAMEQRNLLILKDEETGMSISYVQKQVNTEKFHQEILRDNYPDIYDKCVKFDGKRESYITVRFQ